MTKWATPTIISRRFSNFSRHWPHPCSHRTVYIRNTVCWCKNTFTLSFCSFAVYVVVFVTLLNPTIYKNFRHTRRAFSKKATAKFIHRSCLFSSLFSLYFSVFVLFIFHFCKMFQVIHFIRWKKQAKTTTTKK